MRELWQDGSHASLVQHRRALHPGRALVAPGRRLGRVLELIDDGKYFTLTAGRQTGKTTSLLWLVEHLNAGGKHCAIWVDIQAAREEPDPEKVFRTILEKIDRATARDLPGVAQASPADIATWLGNPQTAVHNALRSLAERHAIELKLRRDTETELRALAQIAGYLDTLGLTEGWLVVFDQRSGRPWEERLSTKHVEHAGKRIHVVGC